MEQAFFLVPYEHSEELSVQHEGVRLFEKLASEVTSEWQPLMEQFMQYIRGHCSIIERFGRFPHRNTILGRSSTTEEIAYLEAGAENFGQSA